MMYVLTCMYVSIFRTQRKQSPNTLHVQFVHWLRCLIRNYGSDYIVGFNLCICCICVCYWCNCKCMKYIPVLYVYIIYIYIHTYIYYIYMYIYTYLYVCLHAYLFNPNHYIKCWSLTPLKLLPYVTCVAWYACYSASIIRLWCLGGPVLAGLWFLPTLSLFPIWSLNLFSIDLGAIRKY